MAIKLQTQDWEGRMMNLISTVGAVTSLELAIIMMASALLLDYRKNHRQRLWRSIAAILEEQDGPALDEPALDRIEQHAA